MYVTNRWTYRKLGMDPEFEFVRDGHIVRACENWSDHNYDFGNIGNDGSGGQIELRPKPSETPEGLVRNCQGLLAEFCKDGRDLSIRGGRYALGAHIHFGIEPLRSIDGNFLRNEFGKIMDWGLGKLLLPTSGASRRTSSYYTLTAIRTNDHGFEYRSLPSSIFHSKKVLTSVLKVCHGLAKKYFNGEGIAIDESHLVDMCGWDRLVEIGGLTGNEREAFQRFVYDFSGSSRGKRIIQAWAGDLVMPAAPVRTPAAPARRERTPAPILHYRPVPSAEVIRPDVIQEIQQQRPVNEPDPPRLRMYNNPNQNILGNGIAVRFNPGEFSEGLVNYIEGLLRGATWDMSRPAQIYFYGLAEERGPVTTSIVYQGRDFLPRSRMPGWRFLERLRVSSGRNQEVLIGIPRDMRIAVNVIGNSLIVSMLQELMRGLYVTIYAINRTGSPEAPAPAAGTINYETGAATGRLDTSFEANYLNRPIGEVAEEDRVPLQHTQMSDGGVPRVEEPEGENDTCELNELNNSLEVGRLIREFGNSLTGAVPRQHRDDSGHIMCSHCSWHNPVTHRCESGSSHHRGALVDVAGGVVNPDYTVDCCSDFHDHGEPVSYYVGENCNRCSHCADGICRCHRVRSFNRRVIYDRLIPTSRNCSEWRHVEPTPDVAGEQDYVCHNCGGHYHGSNPTLCGECWRASQINRHEVGPEFRDERGRIRCSACSWCNRETGRCESGVSAHHGHWVSNQHHRPLEDYPVMACTEFHDADEPLSYYVGRQCQLCMHRQLGGTSCMNERSRSYGHQVDFEHPVRSLYDECALRVEHLEPTPEPEIVDPSAVGPMANLTGTPETCRQCNRLDETARTCRDHRTPDGRGSSERSDSCGGFSRYGVNHEERARLFQTAEAIPVAVPDTIIHVDYYAGDLCLTCGHQVNGICDTPCDSMNRQVVPEPGIRFDGVTGGCSRYQSRDLVAEAPARPSDQPDPQVVDLTYYAGESCRNCLHQSGGVCRNSLTMSHDRQVILPEGTRTRFVVGTDTQCDHQLLREPMTGRSSDGEHDQ